MRRREEIFKLDLSHKAVAVCCYLHDRANRSGECWPAIPTIAREIKLSESTVRRAIRELEQKGCIKTRQRYRRNGAKSSLLYRLP